MHLARKILVAAGLTLSSIQTTHATELYFFQGYRDGGSFDLVDSLASLSLDGTNTTSLLFANKINDKQHFEFLYSHQATSLIMSPGNSALFDLDVDYFHIGGTNLLKRTGATDLYASGGIGATYYSPNNNYGSETRFSLSFGLGAKHYISERVVLRFDGRLFGTLLDSGSGIFCGIGTGGSGCSVAVSGTLATQYELSAGIGIKF